MYSTLYTFGCSFTQYKWPTWADYLHAGGLANKYQNWGLPGGSNDFIFHSVVNCDMKNKITSEDLVVVMWSQTNRLSDYTNNQGWTLLGNAYLYQPKERMKYYSEDKAMLEQTSYIHAVTKICKANGCNLKMFSVEPIQGLESFSDFLGYIDQHDYWRETLPGDHHPSPEEHARFAQHYFDLNKDSVQRLLDKANQTIFDSANPHRQQYIYYPEKLNVPRI